MCWIYMMGMITATERAVRYSFLTEDYTSPTVFKVSTVQKIETRLSLYIYDGTVTIDGKTVPAQLVLGRDSDHRPSEPMDTGISIDAWYSQKQYREANGTKVSLITERSSLRYDLIVLGSLFLLPGMIASGILGEFHEMIAAWYASKQKDNDDPYDIVDTAAQPTKTV